MRLTVALGTLAMTAAIERPWVPSAPVRGSDASDVVAELMARVSGVRPAT